MDELRKSEELQHIEIMRVLLELGLPSEDYVVFGSGPMFIYGIRQWEELGDLDLLARGKAFEVALGLGVVGEAGYGGRKARIGAIEVFEKWGPGEWDVDRVIEAATVVSGIPFARLEDVLRYKVGRASTKDMAHAMLIKKYLNLE